MKNESICAIVVTYNRKELLIECLRGLLRQTIPLDGIYLVDNASKDGTLEYLKENNFLEITNIKENEEYYKELKINNITTIFYYLRLSENKGGAGGFYEGIKNAYSKGFDWLWLMDDDVEPFDNALETQLKYKDISKCIHPAKQYLNGDRYVWEGCLNELDGFEYFKEDDEFLKYSKNFIPVNFGNFEGMLINKEIIKHIGYPNRELFMIGDDTIYGYNASKYTLNIYIKDICFIKKLDNRGKIPSVLKRYLNFRNKYASFFRKIARNKFYWLISFLTITFRKLGSSLIKRKNPQEFYYIIRGIIDGFLENYDMNVVRKLIN